MSWFTESNRWKHFVLMIPVSFVFTILCALGCTSGMEFKDVQYSKYNWKSWDWLDWLCGVLGGIVGQALQVGLFFLIYGK